MTDNIYTFPKSKIVRDSTTMNLEELQKMKAKSLQNFIDTLVQEISESMLHDFDNYGIDIDSEAFVKDFHYLVSVLSATIHRTMNVDHDLHPFLDTHVKMTFVEDEDEIDLTDK